MINEHWSRWTWASVSKHFSNYVRNLTYYIEGHELPREPVEDRIEFRLDGPSITPIAREYKLEIEINILITSIKDDQDAHKMQRIVGLVSTGFTNIISVYRFGDGPEDDGSLLDCYQIKAAEREKIVISHFGLVEPASRVMQSTVEGHYKMVL